MSLLSVARCWFFALLLFAPVLASAAAGAGDTEYRLGAGDLLKINV